MLTWWILNGPITCFKQIHSTKSTSCVLVSMFSSLVTIHNLLRNANFIDGMFFSLVMTFCARFPFSGCFMGLQAVSFENCCRKIVKISGFFFIYFRQNVGLHKKSTRIMLALSTLKRPLSIFSAPLLKNISSKKEYSDGTEKWNKNDCTYNRKCELICHSNNKRDVFLCQRYRMPNAVFISLLIIHGESKWGWTQDNSLFFLV